METANTIDENMMKNWYVDNNRLYWNISKQRIKKHSLAGHKDNKGYYRVVLNGKKYFNHRILYQFYHNVILNATDFIDHIDMDRQNNSKENLRICTKSENAMNRISMKNNKLRIKNIYIDERQNRYVVCIGLNKKRYAEYFDISKFSIDDVIKFRNEKLIELHGTFANLDGCSDC